METALAAGAVGLAALVLGGVIGSRRQRTALGRADATADEVVRSARVEAQRILERAGGEAQALADAHRERVEDDLRHRRLEVEAAQDRLVQREATLEQRAANLAQREGHLIDREREVTEAAGEAERQLEQARLELEALAGVDTKAAKEALMQRVEDEARRDAMVLMRDLETKAREESDRRARRILTSAVQRLASEVVAEATVSIVELPNDEMKGRIIGRDGRNIRAFEAVTGVNIIIDDTPESVTLSAFDPVRREVARRALLRLIEDGRIHPTSIEESYEKAFVEVEQSIRDAGEWAIVEVGVSRVHPEMVNLLGRLRYRMSYGQNVLHHLVESSKIAAMLAAELGADPEEAARAAFLHDIGKAVSHELGGSHALVGAEIARRFGEDPAVVHGIEAHHNEVEPRTLTAIIVQAADAVSAARPGARREAIESYVRRLESLESIAMSFEGVERVYAMQAGREVRVVVDPGTIDDLTAHDLARRISKRFEEELQYPGQIQVTVIRELRATHYAR
jgi:ribonuclease Y